MVPLSNHTPHEKMLMKGYSQLILPQIYEIPARHKAGSIDKRAMHYKEDRLGKRVEEEIQVFRKLVNSSDKTVLLAPACASTQPGKGFLNFLYLFLKTRRTGS